VKGCAAVICNTPSSVWSNPRPPRQSRRRRQLRRSDRRLLQACSPPDRSRLALSTPLAPGKACASSRAPRDGDEGRGPHPAV